MSTIYVKAKEGRVAYDAPRGKRIPTDQFVPVEKTPWIVRLLSHHGDIVEQVEDAVKKGKAAVAPTATFPAPTV